MCALFASSKGGELLFILFGIIYVILLALSKTPEMWKWYVERREENKRRRESRRQERARNKYEKEQEKRRKAAERNKPTKEQLVEELNEFYESQLKIIDGSVMEETEKGMAQDNEKRHYLRRLDQLMRINS